MTNLTNMTNMVNQTNTANSENRFRTIIFDLDGTLLDTLDDLWASTNYALEQCGYPTRTREEVRRFVGNGVKNLILRAVPEGTSEDASDACLTIFREHYKEHLNDHTGPYAGIMELLQTLRADGCRIGVVSNKFDAAVKLLCAEYFGELIDAAIGESPAAAKKPAPDTVFLALKELNASADTAVYIGDSEVDIQTAANASLPCISVTWGFRSRELLAKLKPDYLCDTASEVLAVIRGL